MNCARYRGLLSRYVDGEVTARQRRELLAHIEGCAECAAWLAKARQADVLLKGGAPALRPSNRVRETILGAVKHEPTARRGASRLGRLRMVSSELLLRLDPAPRHYVLALVVLVSALTGVAYWQGLIPWSGHDQLGFLVQSDDGKESVDSTPLPAISRGAYGVGGPVAVPNHESLFPHDGSQEVDPAATLGARFDQPMDRRSVERALTVDPPTGGQFSWDADNAVRFTPDTPLLRGVTYTLTLTGTARSLYGIPLGEPVYWSFHTRDPYGVLIEPSAGMSIAPTTTFTVRFETPMAPEGVRVALISPSQALDLPATFLWDASDESLTVTPKGPLPPGEVRLLVGADSVTKGGEALGQAYEAEFAVDAPLPRLRLAGERVQVLRAGTPHYLRYEAMINAAGAAPAGLTLDFYSLPIERLAALGAQARERAWPMPLPPQAREGLTLTRTVHLSYAEIKGSNGKARVPDLAPGAYLVLATAPQAGGALRDWQALIVADGSILPVDSGSLWATDRVGRAWAGSELLLFGPDGALLGSGQADELGLWTPKGGPTGATLGIARDTDGGIAAAVWNPALPPPAEATGTLDATLRTDRHIYAPGGAVNFRVGLRLPTPLPAAPLPPTGGSNYDPPAGEEDIQVSLLHPNGASLSTLTLTPDEVGGASGAFTLSPGAVDAEYKVRVQWRKEYKNFPLLVRAAQGDTFSVFILPAAPEILGMEIVTRTVSVLGAAGEPVVGAVLTGTLGVVGDSWVSEPITTTTDGAGRATLAARMPLWATYHTDPSFMLRVEARNGERSGSDAQYLDHLPALLREHSERHLASPSLNISAIARSMVDGSTELELSPLDDEAGIAGDLLLLAQAPTGEALLWTLDISTGLTATLPATFQGGRILLMRAGIEGHREIELPPPTSDALIFQTEVNVQPGAPLSVTLALADEGSSYSAGAAAIWFRRAGGPSILNEACGWESGMKLSESGPVTATVTAPGAPGLWYVMVEAAGVGGERGLAQRVVRVLPGPTLQLPPTQQARVGEGGRASIVVHNMGKESLSSGLRADTGPLLRTLNGGSQPVDVEAGGWQRLDWRYSPQAEGDAQLLFTFMPSAKVGGRWVLDVQAGANERATVTHVAGSVTEQGKVGVQVPSGLEADAVRLEVRASTQLLPTLASIATGPLDKGVMDGPGRFGSLAGVASAYFEVGAPLPEGLGMDAPQRSSLLDVLYGSQLPDGGWGAEPEATISNPIVSAWVLLSLRREALALDSLEPGQKPPVQPDAEVIRRGLDYLGREAQRPVAGGTEALNARTYTLYTLALYGKLSADAVRPYMEYAASGLGSKGLSLAGQAWLSLALRYTGDHVNSFALLERLLIAHAEDDAQVAAPMLELLLAEDALIARGVTERATLAQAYARTLMDNRRGSGWATPRDTADALWSLSRYAALMGERPRPGGTPTIELNSRPIEVEAEGSTVQVALTGNTLHPGTNWLELRPATPGQPLYYSLTLWANR